VRSGDPIALLGTINKIVFENEEGREYVYDASISAPLPLTLFPRWLNLDITTDDVKANCSDLKVLGKGDFKTLLKWRLALREEVSLKPTGFP
jgi:AdoMet-dependent rRNA methyltransferase SPB1